MPEPTDRVLEIAEAMLSNEQKFAQDEISGATANAIKNLLQNQLSELPAEEQAMLDVALIQVGDRMNSARQSAGRIRAKQLRIEACLLGEQSDVPGVPTDEIIELSQLPSSSPLRAMWNVIQSQNVNWTDDSHNASKAFVLACLSEITYLSLSDRELEIRPRYRLFAPSGAANVLHQARSTFRPSALAGLLDARVEVIFTKSFVFFVLDFGRFAVIAVRGTVPNCVADWLLDMNALKVPAKKFGFYHRGFYEEASEALPNLVAAAQSISPLYITGHSLGGAVAAVLSQIWDGPIVPKTPYTFSSPRFGTPSVAKRQPRFSYRHVGDVVPHLPPRLLGYSDLGSERYNIGAGAEKRDTWERVIGLPRFGQAHSIEGLRTKLGESLGLSNGPGNYVDALAEQIAAVKAAGG